MLTATRALLADGRVVNDLNPVVLTDSSCRAVDARIRVEPVEPADPYLRRLRS